MIRTCILFLLITKLTVLAGTPPVGIIPDINKLKIPVIERHAPVVSKDLLMTVDGGNIGGARKNWPVRFAVPIERGELKNAENINLKTADGKSIIPVSGKPTAFWPEGEVKWLLLEFMADLPENGQSNYVLTYGTSVKPVLKSDLKITEDKGSISVSTGVISFNLTKKSEFLSDIISNGTGITPKGKGLRCFLDYSVSGVKAPESMSTYARMNIPLTESEPSVEILKSDFAVDTISIVEKNQIQVTVQIDGKYNTSTVSHPVRIYLTAYNNSSLVKIRHSLIYAGFTVRDYIKSYGFDLSLSGDISKCTFGIEGGKPLEGTGFCQRDDQTYILDRKTQKDGRSDGWVKAGNVAVAVENLWKNYPSTFSVAQNNKGTTVLKTSVFGPEEGAFLDFRYRTGKVSAEVSAMRPGTKGAASYYVSTLSDDYDGGGSNDARGIQKTHTVMYDFNIGKKESTSINLLGKALDKKPVIFTDPAHFADTSVLGIFSAYEADPEFQKIKNAASVVFDWASFTQDKNRWYGFVDSGDLNASAKKPDGDKLPHYFAGGIGWSSGNHYGTAFLIHAFLTKQRKYIDFTANFLKHKVDFDFEHIGGQNEGALLGEFTRHNQVHWRGGGEPRQAPIADMIFDYWITGDRVGWDGITLSMEWLNKAAWGRSAILDKTKLNMSCKAGAMNWPAYLMWETTGDPKYMWFVKPFAKALEDLLDAGIGISYQEGIIPVSVEGRPDISGYRDGGAPGGYFFTYDAHSPLIAYVNLTGDKDVTRSLIKTAYLLEQAPINCPQHYDTLDSFLDFVYGITGDRTFLEPILNQRIAQFMGFRGVPKEEYTTQTLISTLGRLFEEGTNNMGLVITGVKPIRYSMHSYLLSKKYPSANAGKNIVTNASQDKGTADIKLDASKSAALNGGKIVEYEWAIEDKPANKVVSKKEIDLIQLPIGKHKVMLKVKDNSGFESFDRVIVTVNPGGLFKFNFAPNENITPPEYTVANGIFNEKDGFGWDSQVSIYKESTVRYGLRIEGDSASVPNKEKKVFKVKAPNGMYKVSFGVGNPYSENGEQHLSFGGGKIKLDMILAKSLTVAFVHIPVEVKDGYFTMEAGGRGTGTTSIGYLCLEPSLSTIKPYEVKAAIDSISKLGRVGFSDKLPAPYSNGLKFWNAEMKPLKMPVVSSIQLPGIETDLAGVPAGSKREFNLKLDSKWLAVNLEDKRCWLDIGLTAPSAVNGPVSISVEGKEVFKIESIPEKTFMRIRNILFPTLPSGAVNFTVTNGDPVNIVGVGYVRVEPSSYGYIFTRKFPW